MGVCVYLHLILPFNTWPLYRLYSQEFTYMEKVYILYITDSYEKLLTAT